MWLYKRPHAGIILARPDAGEQIELVPQMHVDAAEAGPDRRGDGRLQGTSRAADARQRFLRQGGAGLRHDIDARLLHVPIDFHAGGIDATPRRFGQIRSGSIASN